MKRIAQVLPPKIVSAKQMRSKSMALYELEPLSFRSCFGFLFRSWWWLLLLLCSCVEFGEEDEDEDEDKDDDIDETELDLEMSKTLLFTDLPTLVSNNLSCLLNGKSCFDEYDP